MNGSTLEGASVTGEPASVTGPQNGEDGTRRWAQRLEEVAAAHHLPSVHDATIAEVLTLGSDSPRSGSPTPRVAPVLGPLLKDRRYLGPARLPAGGHDGGYPRPSAVEADRRISASGAG